MGLASRAKQAIRNNIEQRKQERHEAQEEQKKLSRIEKESRQKEREHQASERGKRSVQKEYGSYQKSNGPRKASSGRRSGGGFMFQPAPDPLMGLMGGRKPKPKAPATKVVARVQAGNKIVTVREKAEATEEQKKKKPQYDFYDPFAI